MHPIEKGMAAFVLILIVGSLAMAVVSFVGQ